MELVRALGTRIKIFLTLKQIAPPGGKLISKQRCSLKLKEEFPWIDSDEISMLDVKTTYLFKKFSGFKASRFIGGQIKTVVLRLEKTFSSSNDEISLLMIKIDAVT